MEDSGEVVCKAANDDSLCSVVSDDMYRMQAEQGSGVLPYP